MFNFVSNGKINLSGCYRAHKVLNFQTKFNKGDIAWIRKKATKGILEAISIKEVRILGGRFSFNQVSAIYTDTYNFLYNEDELIFSHEALQLKEAYCNTKKNFKYNSIAKLNLNSCNGYNPQTPITTKFQVGEIAYLKNKAKKGKIEAVFIEKLKITNQVKCNFIDAIYIDNLNFYYNENELINLTEAIFYKNEYCYINSQFKYNSTAKLNLNSCNGYDPQTPITTKFQVGEVVFLVKKARIGILESIFIKQVKKINEVKCKYINSIYIDNTNFYYNESELVNENEAKDLIKQFVIERIQGLNQSKLNCSNSFKNVVAKCKV